MKRKSLFATLIALTLILAFGTMLPNALADKVLIGFTTQPGGAEEALVRGVGGTIKYTYHLVPAIAADVPGQAIAQLRANRQVIRIDPDGKVFALDAELDNTWGVKRIGAGVVHDGGNKGTGVKVAVIDSGIDYAHPDLDANYISGYDFVNDDTEPMDDYGHGTHVAGTVAAEDNDLGDVGVVGVAPEAALYALKVLDESGSGDWSDVIAAIEWATDPNGDGDTSDHLDVTNLSLGSDSDPGSTVKSAFDNAYQIGVLHVAAAGNSGNPPGKGDNVGYPARYDSVIAVAATDKNDERARWSSTGPDVELSAPGVDINSTLLGGGYGEKNGTSMASPHVAGTAALVIAAGITDANGDGLINDEVRLRLQETADDLGDVGWDPLYGFGLVDADEAADIGLPNDPPTVSITSPADGSTFDSGATILFEGTASDTEDGDLTASLVWTSDIDSQIGTGGSFSTTLNNGNHAITASVTDSGGKTGSDSISITVGTPPTEPTTVRVDSITYATEGGKNSDKHLLIIVALVDDLENPVADASVSIRLDNTNTGQSWTGTGTTGTDGTVTFSLKNAPDGCYTTTVTAVTAEGLDWDGKTPENGFRKGDSAAPARVNLSSEPIVEGPIFELKLVSPTVVKVEKTVLRQNYPNPFNPETWIPFELSKSEPVLIKIYSSSGELVRTLDLGSKQAGAYVPRDKAAYWDGKNQNGEKVSSGVYFYLMEAGSFRAMKKMVIMK